MKTLHLTLGLAAIASLLSLGSCNRAEVQEEFADVAYSVSPTTVTRASLDKDGQAACVTRYICEVYNEGELYIRKVNAVSAGTLQTTFNLRLVKSHDYEVLFWADASAGESDLHYKTDGGLKAVSLKGAMSGNDDALDAFFAKDVITNMGDDYQKDIILTRPFAQLNVITDDIADIRASLIADKMEPDKVTVKVKAPVSFNVSTGRPGAAADVEYTADVYYKVSGQNAAPYYTLSMSYIFAEDTKTVGEVGFTALNSGTVLTSCTFDNIPLQRNWRTNIIGPVLTNSASWKVIIDPEWETPDFDITM